MLPLRSFSGEWCPPCRAFTPQLVGFYEEHGAELSLELVYASVDNDEEAFQRYFQKMPWLALPYSGQGRHGALHVKLKELYDVPGYPTLVIGDGDSGAVCSKFVGSQAFLDKAAGVAGVLSSPAAIYGEATGIERFPW
eukprot:SAG22_NODE_10233_length_546_cov_0.872483_1_plen_137_part_01